MDANLCGQRRKTKQVNEDDKALFSWYIGPSDMAIRASGGCVKGYAISDVGRVRKNNEDSILLSDSRGLFAVADGMGGHNAGEVASLIAVETLFRFDVNRGINNLQQLREAFIEANANIVFTSLNEQKTYGMGTTLTVVKIVGNYALFGHIGDSRLYFIGKDFDYQVTEDHSLVWEQFRTGILTKDECRFHPQKNIITRALGQSEELVVDLGVIKLRKGGVFLLCSDGLSDMLSDNDLATTVIENIDDPNMVLKGLQTHALNEGGVDNVTVVLVFLEESDWKDA